MNYFRVIPRDFFNESKLLKCLGQFELCVLDRQCNGLEFVTRFDGGPFEIVQNEADASLSCSNYRVFLDGDELELFAPYNSKENYPLMGRYRGSEYYIFNEKGNLMPNFGIVS